MNIDIRKDFPILQTTTTNGYPIVYLDSAATSQLPNQVIDAMGEYYRTSNANPHRGAYELSTKATAVFDNAKERVAKFIGATSADEIIFTKGATESANLLARGLAETVLTAEDEIVIGISEHHANMIPWQQAVRQTGAKLVYLYLDNNGLIPSSEIESKITENTKIVSIAHVSNVLGTENPVEEIIAKAKSVGAITILDAAQSVPHRPVNVQELDVDFLYFSGHKMMAPEGIGVLYGKKQWLEQIPPFIYGGDMIEYVTEQDATFASPPQKFEGGTQNVVGAAGLIAAIDYLENIGMNQIAAHEKELGGYALKEMLQIPYLTIYGSHDMKCRGGLLTFNIKDCHPHDVATILDHYGICIRSGHHCAQPLMTYLGVSATCRMSLYSYNNKTDVDYFIEHLKQVRRWLGHEH